MTFSKAKCQVLHVGWGSPWLTTQAGDELINNSPVQKDLGCWGMRGWTWAACAQGGLQQGQPYSGLHHKKHGQPGWGRWFSPSVLPWWDPTCCTVSSSGVLSTGKIWICLCFPRHTALSLPRVIFKNFGLPQPLLTDWRCWEERREERKWSSCQLQCKSRALPAASFVLKELEKAQFVKDVSSVWCKVSCLCFTRVKCLSGLWVWSLI